MKKLIAVFVLSNFSIAQTPGNSLSFDGSNDYVSCALPAVFNDIPNNDFTMEAWIKPTGSVFCRVIFAQFNSSNFASLSLGTNRQIFFYVNNTASFETTATLPLNSWSHVACTWDASAAQTNVYINGVLQAGAGGGSSSTGNDNIMTIGTRTNLAQFFPGELDEVRIWDVARTPCDISAGMTSEYTTAQPNLVAYYNFNQGTAGGTNTGVTNLPDFTTNYNGTLNGFDLTGGFSNWLASGANINAVNQAGSVATGTDTRTECSPFVWIDGNTYTSNNNTATFNIQGGAFNGCDSLVTLDLTVISPSAGTDLLTECAPFIWIDGNTYTSNNNTATFNIQGGASNGCDSLVTLDLTILSPATGTDVVSECTSFTWIDGNTYMSNNNTATFNIAGGASNGCDSLVTLDLTILNPTSGTDTRSECAPFVWIDGNSYTANNNTATFNIVGGASNGCDSLVTLDLTINTVSDLSTTTSGITVTANNTAATYQWLDCDNNNAVIAGATGQSYTATMNGNYAVELTENGCVDTSACAAITTVGILENTLGDALIVYPNPSYGNFSVDLGAAHQSISIRITDINGRHIFSKEYSDLQVIELSISEPAGVYLLTVDSADGNALIRLVKK